MAADVPRFEDMVRQHRRGVLRICRSILGDEHLGLDAAQITFFRLWRRCRRDGPPDHPSAWLRRAAASSALDLQRQRASRTPEVPLRVGDDVAAKTPLAFVDDEELGPALRAAVQDLPEGQRAVFLLRHACGIPLREAARMLGVSLPTAKTQFARACMKLQSRLRPWHPDRESSHGS